MADAKSSTHDKKKEPEKKSDGPDPPKSGKLGPRERYEKYTPLKLEPAEVLETAAGYPEMRQGPRGHKRKEPKEKHDEKRKSHSRDAGDPPPQKMGFI
ncbi:hypothetical protein ACS0TY_024183 [Phlomoides rotata]